MSYLRIEERELEAGEVAARTTVAKADIAREDIAADQPQPRMNRVFWISTSLLLGFAALVAIVALQLGGTGESDAEQRSQVIALTAIAAAVAGSIAVGGLALIKRQSGFLGWVFIASSVGWLVLCLRLFLDPDFLEPSFGPPEQVKNWGWTAFLALIAELMVTAGAVMAHGRRSRVLLGLTAASATAAIVLSAVTMRAEYAYSEAAARTEEKLYLASVLAWIVTLVCLLLTPVLQRRRSLGS